VWGGRNIAPLLPLHVPHSGGDSPELGRQVLLLLLLIIILIIILIILIIILLG